MYTKFLEFFLLIIIFAGWRELALCCFVKVIVKSIEDKLLI